MRGQHNVRASAEDNTDKGHTPNLRTEIKIPYPAGNRTRAAGNRTRAAGLEGRDSTDDGDGYKTISLINVYTGCFNSANYIKQ